MRSAFGLFAALILAACTNFPEIDAANRDAGPLGAPPPLLPFEDLAMATAGNADRATDTSALDARADALRARAAILRQPVTADGDIDRLRAELDQLP